VNVPRNRFKAALSDPNAVQYGLWLGMASPVAAEIAASAGFDWLLIDGEHGPNDLRAAYPQLQAIAGYPVTSIVRPADHGPVLVKQYLDCGAQTLLVPMVESADQAAELVRLMRYPPRGVRGVATTRASRWGLVTDYWDQAADELALIVQVETVKGLESLEAITRVDGVDAVFIGPSDLAADLGYLGRPACEQVVKPVREALSAVRKVGKGAGVLAADLATAAEYRLAGANFIGLGVDVVLLARTAAALLHAVKTDSEKS
jgi:4-hydroxy-2-oxoheptanedioate aldolase